jgi:hypothetical protein
MVAGGETLLNSTNEYQSTAPNVDIRILANMYILFVGRKTTTASCKMSAQRNTPGTFALSLTVSRCLN